MRQIIQQVKSVLRSPLFFLFCVALLLRLAYLKTYWQTVPDWGIDAQGYHQLAINIIERNVFSLNGQPPFQPDAIRTPVYPLFIALVYYVFGIAPHVVLIAQTILDSITTLLVAVTAWQCTRSRRVATVAGVLYAIYPTTWIYTTELYVESVLAFGVILTFWFATQILSARGDPQARWTVGAGLASGLCLLIKPNVVLLPLILGGSLLVQKKFRAAIVFAAVIATILAPWILRNTLVFGRPMLSTVFENNLMRVSAPATLAQARGEDVAPWTPRWEELFFQVVEIATRADPTLFNLSADKMTPRQLDQAQIELADAARSIIVQYPAAFVISHVKGTLHGLPPQDHRYWYQLFTGETWESVVPGGMFAAFFKDSGYPVPLLAVTLFVFFAAAYALAYALAMVGTWRLYHTEPVLVLAIVAFVVYMIFLPGPISQERFRVPIVPLACVLMASAVYRGADVHV
jgi:4-amino-4-deoxy-L-arabinose transferase-like glycosyltransferase